MCCGFSEIKSAGKVCDGESMKVEQAVLQHIQTHGIGNTPWVVKAGTAAQLDSMVGLVESELYGDKEMLVKTMRPVREALLSIAHDVEYGEMHCMIACGCLRTGKHLKWPSFTAGCHPAGSENGT